MTISVQNRQRKHRLDLQSIREFAKRALELVAALQGEAGDRFPVLEQIGITLVSDLSIAKLHVQFMQIEGATDVLTFDEGDIVISAETAAHNARVFGQTLEAEICLYLIHGLLHLRGFEDHEAKMAREMSRLQQRILAQAWRD